MVMYHYFMNSWRISCLIPARNEAGRLETTVKEAFATQLIDEVIIIEGGSSDNTWTEALALQNKFPNLKAIRQDGKGKFDAVRKGLAFSCGELIVIWDADGTVRPIDCEKLISTAVKEQRTTIGNRLKGTRHPDSMRLANLVGNYAFAALWSLVLGGKIHDLLCGSKVFTRVDFEGIPSWVLKTDPFGDFSLVASAIVNRRSPISIPVDYFPRDYGQTNIKRWSSGVKLLSTSVFCFFWIAVSRLRRTIFAR